MVHLSLQRGWGVYTEKIRFGESETIMSSVGWISLHRKIQDCFLWIDKEPFDHRSAWIDLLLLANHEDKKTMFDGKVLIVKRGERITSILALSERWHWSRHKTSNFLDVLEKEGMIIQKRDNKKTLITIVNYDVYQLVDSKTGHQKDIKGTSEGHQKDTNNNTNNENKKDIPSKSETAGSVKRVQAEQLFERLWKMYPRKEGKGQVSLSRKNTLLSIGEEQMIRCIERYKKAKANTDMQYLMHGSTFFNSGYVDYLDQNFDCGKKDIVSADANKVQEERELTDDEFDRLVDSGFMEG